MLFERAWKHLRAASPELKCREDGTKEKALVADSRVADFVETMIVGKNDAGDSGHVGRDDEAVGDGGTKATVEELIGTGLVWTRSARPSGSDSCW
jgi:hypothetical protein